MVNSTDDPKVIVIAFPGIPCSTNRAWRTFSRHWVLSDKYLETKQLVGEAVRRLPRLENGCVMPWRFCRVTIRLFPPNWRQIDVDNRSKTLFDALTDARFWPDDSCVAEMTVQKCAPVRDGLTIVEFTEGPERVRWPENGFPGITLEYLPRKGKK